MIIKCVKKDLIIKFIEELENVMFCECGCLKHAKELYLEAVNSEEENANAFFSSLEDIKNKLENDLNLFLESDPAIDGGREEIIACYPGFRAIIYYRIANQISKLGNHLVARIISEHAHFLTGIDIHPASQIGCPFFIDHGTGIVIGETAVVGDYVKLYQGVTLGALSLAKGSHLRGTKRHPTIGNNVTIYANASILGGDVVIGNNVVIGGNVYLTESIPDNHKVLLQKPELVLIKK